MHSSQPIGIFDSGIGGLTVAQAITTRLPHEDIIYVGDTAHLPYGDKSEDAILSYSRQIAKFLYAQGCKILVIACNTASSAAYQTLVEEWAGRMLIVDVISPLVEDIAKKPFRKVGVIATKATIRSNAYTNQLHALRPNLEVAALATSLLAKIIEEGFFNNDVSKAIIHKYLSYTDFEDIDALLLACKHYPLIHAEIDEYFGGSVQIFDSVDAVTNRVEHILSQHNLLNTNALHTPTYRFLVSDYTQAFEQTTRYFYNRPIPLEVVKWHDDALILQEA